MMPIDDHTMWQYDLPTKIKIAIIIVIITYIIITKTSNYMYPVLGAIKLLVIKVVI